MAKMSVKLGIKQNSDIRARLENGQLTLEVLPWAQTFCQAAEVVLPSSMTASGANHGGNFSSRDNTLKWGPFMDDMKRTLTARVLLTAEGVTALAVTLSVDGQQTRYAVFSGQSSVRIPSDRPKLVYQQGNNLTLLGQIGQTYAIQVSPDLKPGNWRLLKTVTPDSWITTIPEVFTRTKAKTFYRAAISREQ